MATLQNIRNRGKLIAIIIGLALLAFIVGDFLNNGSSIFRAKKEIVGEIAGETLKYKDWQAAYDQLQNVYKIEYNQSQINEEMATQLRNSVWDNFVNEKILNAEAKKLGLSVSKEELTDRLIGKNIHPLIMQRRAFAGENGQFSRDALLHFYNSVFNNPQAQSEEAQQQLKEAKSYWLFWENAVKNAILQEKYAALFAKTAGANNIEAKYNYDARKETGDVSYVVQPYFSVSDSAIQVSQAELKDRYNKEKEMFKQEANRSIEYVAFEIAPMPEDFKEGEEWIKKVSEDFKTTNDVAGLVNSESDISYDPTHNYSMQTVPANLKSFAFGNPTGAIYGPVFENNTYTMAKVMEGGIMESDSLKLSHIVVANDKTADSIMTAIRGGAKFSEMAMKHSLAQQTAQKGGDIGWVNVHQAGKELAENAKKGKGELFKLSMPQGVQVFKIDDKSPARPKVKLAVLERKITASTASQNKFFNQAKQFAVAAKSAGSLEKAAKEKSLIIHPAENLFENTDKVNMIPQSRQIVRWAFKEGKGVVSDVFECGAQYVVASLKEISPKGYQSIEKVTPQLKAEIIRDKKADIIAKNMADQLAKNPDLAALATSTNTQVKVAPAINFNSFQFGDAGFEPTVIGKASVLAAGKVSAPIKGNAGVYVIQPAAKQADTAAFNAKMEAMQMDSRASYSLPYTIIEKLKEKYKTTDNRSNFY